MFAAEKKGSGHQDVLSPWWVKKRSVTKEGKLPIVPLPPARDVTMFALLNVQVTSQTPDIYIWKTKAAYFDLMLAL